MSEAAAIAPTVGATAMRIAPLAVVARGVAFALPVLIAALYGATPVTDAFFYAMAFPTFLMVIVANAFGTVSTPTFARIAAQDPRSIPRFVGAAATLSTAAATGLGLGIILVLRPLLPWVTSFAPDVQRLTWEFVAELLPFMALVGAGVVLRSACDVHGRFLATALSPLLRGGTAIAVLVALHQPLGAHALALAMDLGQAAEVGWYLAILGHAGLRPVPGFGIDPRLRAALAMIVPVLGGEVLVASNLVVDKAFAGLLGPGAVSILEYADRTRFIPQTFAETTLLVVAYATWANLLARGDRAAFARQIDQAMRWLAACLAPVLAGLFVGRRVLFATLYAHGAFSAADADASADAFGLLIPGLWCMLLGAAAMRAHVLEGRLRLVFALGVLSVLANAAFDGLLLHLGVNGLALSSTITWILVPGVYVAALIPTIREAAAGDRWPVVGLVVAASLVVATVVECGPGAPTRLTDPALALAAIACFTLLGLAIRATAPE
jgi:putative peptidoglycan lipid II flippase